MCNLFIKFIRVSFCVCSMESGDLALDRLSKDALTSIFRMCSQKSLFSLMLVSKRFREVIVSDYVLRKLLQTWVFGSNFETKITSLTLGSFHTLLHPSTSWSRFVASFSVKQTTQNNKLRSHFCVGLSKIPEAGSVNLGSLSLAYFADGDCWSFGNHANYEKGFGPGSLPFTFTHGDVISILFERDIKSSLFGSGKDVYLQIVGTSKPNCVVSFFATKFWCTSHT